MQALKVLEFYETIYKFQSTVKLTSIVVEDDYAIATFTDESHNTWEVKMTVNE